MKNALSLLSALALLALLAPAPARAWSLFGSSPEAKLLARADEAYEEAMSAHDSGDAIAELEALQSARSSYQRLADEHPSYRADYVFQRLNATTSLASDVSASIESGATSIADPVAAVDRNTEPGAPIAAPNATDPSAPAFRNPIPVLVQTDDGAKPAGGAAPAPAPAPDVDPSLAAAIPNPFYRGKPDEPAAAAGDGSGASATVEVTLREADAPAVSPETDLRNARVFLDMIRAARATDAVLLIEDRLEEEGSSASLLTRIVYARALVQCGNYRRAADVLAALPKEAEGDPSVRSLRAAVAVGNDDLEDALLQLTLLLRDHPGYADAYVNLAYVYHLLDPVNNRNAAIANYKVGLERGAKRDGRLETALDVRVGR